MVPGRGVAFDVSYAVATTSTVAIVMLPTESIASIPLNALYDAVVPDTIRRLEAGATFHLALTGIL